MIIYFIAANSYIPITTPVEDTNSDRILDNSFCSNGEILQQFPLVFLAMQTETMIISFDMQLFEDSYCQQNHPPDDPSPLSPSVCCDYSSKHNSIPIPLLLL